MTVGKNIIIDFSIIQKSDHSKLMKELDQLVALKNNIYLWSKTVHPTQMKLFCQKIKFDLQDKIVHQEIIKLRSQKKSFKEISEATKVPIEQISFYLTAKLDKVWTLDDWIKDYLVKDSSVYQKADFVIDPDPKFVNRFQLKGMDGNVLEKL